MALADARSGAAPVRPNLVLGTCCLSLLVVGMDVTIVNVALPAIQRDLHASLSGLQWIVDMYTLIVASLLMLSGSLSDRFGRRRVFQIGLVLFTGGSLLCSVAHSMGQLIAARGLQGLGASMLNPLALSIIANVFREPKDRARAVGGSSFVRVSRDERVIRIGTSLQDGLVRQSFDESTITDDELCSAISAGHVRAG